MRDPSRIDKTLDRLGRLWKRYPDMRLSQLIGNVFPHVCGNLDCKDKVYDPYHLEDDTFIAVLYNFYSSPRVHRVRGKVDLIKILRKVFDDPAIIEKANGDKETI